MFVYFELLDSAVTPTVLFDRSLLTSFATNMCPRNVTSGGEFTLKTSQSVTVSTPVHFARRKRHKMSFVLYALVQLTMQTILLLIFIFIAFYYCSLLCFYIRHSVLLNLINVS